MRLIKTYWLLLLVVVLLAGLIGFIWFNQPRATHLSGDAWDYALQPADLGDWQLVNQSVVTPHDFAPTGPLTTTSNLATLTQMYYAQYDAPSASAYLHLALQIILYPNDAQAQAALAAENPGAEWQSLQPGVIIGNASRLWHYGTAEADSASIYRLDFRYLNSVSSLSVIGTPAGSRVQDVIAYAEKIFAHMKKSALPPELKRLQAAGLPDLRALLLSQAQVNETTGDWQIWSESLPCWTPTDKLQTETARRELGRLGRITGYQMYLYNPQSQIDATGGVSYVLIQQISAYQNAENAQAALKMLSGLEQIKEQPAAPLVGDAARGWVGLMATEADGSPAIIAAGEIDFRVGRYVASVRVQSRPLETTEQDAALAENWERTTRLGQMLAANLAASGK